MKNLLSVFSVLVFLSRVLPSQAQSSMPKQISDSLWGVWNNAALHDTIRAEALGTFSRDGYVFSQPDSAIYYLQILENFAFSKQLSKQYAFALNNIGVAAYIKSDFVTALDYFEKALIVYEELGNKNGMANANSNIGMIYNYRGDQLKSRYYHTLALEFRKEIDAKSGIIISINNIGVSYLRDSEFQLAKSYFLQSLSLSAALNDKNNNAYAYHNLGLVMTYLGDYTAALDYLKHALLIRQELGNKQLLGSTLGSIGNAYENKGDYVKAINYYLQAFDFFESVGDLQGSANSISNIGVIYSNQGDYQKAIESYQKALSIFLEIGDKFGAGYALNGIGSLYGEWNQLDTALIFLRQGLELREQIQDKTGIAESWMNLGEVYLLQKNFERALECFSKCLKIRTETKDKAGISVVHKGIAQVYFLQNNFALSLSHAATAYNLAVEIQHPKNLQSAAALLFQLYLKEKKNDDALKILSEIHRSLENELAINYFSLSENAKELYFQTLENDFGLYYDFTCFYHQTYPNTADTAFNIALQNKGLTLKSSTAMRTAVLNSGDSLLLSVYENWIDLRRQISDNYSKGENTKELEFKADDLEKELIRKSNLFSDFDKIKKLNWKDVQASLKPDECAIEFVHFKSVIDSSNQIIYMALLIKSDSDHPQVIKLCTENELIEILGAFQGNNIHFVRKVYGSATEAQTALYEKIWQPLEPYLQNVNSVFYSPSGLLHKVSFAALSKSQNVYLSDLYYIRPLNTTGNLVTPDQTTFGELENFLLMGGVNYKSSSGTNEVWSYLPGSLQETETINTFLQKKKFGVNYFKSENASEQILKEKIVSSSFVHIATHGFFFPDPEKVRAEMLTGSDSENDQLEFRAGDLNTTKGTTNYANWSFVNNKNPLMRSGIVLANANDVWSRDPLAEGEDGILTAQEVSNLDLRNTKLVVLSACETGLGDIKGSEGVFGLQRAFKMAGVKYLIMSLWQVPDKETSEFMILFYKNLIKVKDIPTAFQKTQKAMREKYDPYYWGAFVLIE